MTPAALASALAYYALHSASLFPIPAGSKSPVGIVASFAKDCSHDPAQWERWRTANPGCNFGVVAGPSRLVIADIDIAELGRERAWELWAQWCMANGLPVLAPHVQSARGGWHVYFSLPGDLDPATLRQVALVGPTDGSKKAIVDLRVGNGFTVAAGSYYDGTARGEASGPYVLLSEAPPHAAPDALLKHCKRAAPAPAAAASRASLGTRDRGDVAALMRWLAERDAFADYESWVGAGMALKLEFGDDGLEVWQLTHDATVDGDTEATKWQSFASEPTPDSVTLSTWLDRAHKLGWRGTVRKSASAMFDSVAAIAHASGATLASAPGSPRGVPMTGGQEVLTEKALPILSEFLTSTSDAPLRPVATDYPDLPASMESHGLYAPMRECIARVMAMAEGKPFKVNRCVHTLGVLGLVHPDVLEALCRRLEMMGHRVPRRQITFATRNLSDQVQHICAPLDSFLCDGKGLPEADNSDNVAIFLGTLGCEIRQNEWLEQMEIRGGTDSELHWAEWTRVDDPIVARLRTRANRTHTRFRPGKDFFWEALVALAHANRFDPVCALLDQLSAEWDGTPRLSIWLSATCGVTCDLYHQAVARNIVGGMVQRARIPGHKHDTMAVLYGPQGTGKSTLTQILALNMDWYTDAVMLGDASKELVLSLAGKLVVEIGEMGMRSSTSASLVKKMLSTQFDEGRPAYARSVTKRLRRNIFIGTTNDNEPLSDPSGNRRFLPVQVPQEIDLEWLRVNVRQVIGEAARRQTAGESFDIPRDIWVEAAIRQEAARQESDMEIVLDSWFAPTQFTGDVSYITAKDLAELGKLSDWRGNSAQSARTIKMRQMGFREESPTIAGIRTKVWVRAPLHVRPADIPRLGVRYMVTVDSHRRPNVVVRAIGDTVADLPRIGAS